VAWSPSTHHELCACRAVKDHMETDPQVRQTVGYLEKQLMR
jgi:hypothetical protein